MGLTVTVYVQICSKLNLHLKTPNLLIIIDFYRTNRAILLKKLEIQFHSKQNVLL